MLIVVPDDSRFTAELANAGSKLVVVDFMASWCVPCIRIAPLFEELSARYQNVMFLRVDVDQCPETASTQGVKAMPTFAFYRNKVKLSFIQGADPKALEDKLKELAGGSEDEESDPGLKGHMDLNSFLNRLICECLNDSDDHPFSECLVTSEGYMESDCDEQLIMNFGFTQAVKLHSLKILAPEENGPKNLKIFINQPHTLDFEEASSLEPTQNLEIKPDELSGKPIPLKFVKYQNVQNLQIFVVNNQGSTEVTRMDQFVIFGSPISMTKMSDFKRIAGKKGESH